MAGLTAGEAIVLTLLGAALLLGAASCGVIVWNLVRHGRADSPGPTPWTDDDTGF